MQREEKKNVTFLITVLISPLSSRKNMEETNFLSTFSAGLGKLRRSFIGDVCL